MLPPHVHYVEPFAGGLSVLLAKDPAGVSEVVNDIDADLTNFWAVLRDPALFPAFLRIAEATPFCEAVWRAADPTRGTAVERAWAFFVRCRQSLAGRVREFATLSRTRTRRGMNEQASAWWSAVDGLPAVHARLRPVVILNRDVVDVIRQQDGPGTLFYLDPPYLAETRAAGAVYAHEMTEGQHVALLAGVKRCTGKVLLSGYDSPLYREELSDWTRREFRIPNHAAGGKAKRTMTEVIWSNF
jgi:DNA adenine methylase